MKGIRLKEAVMVGVFLFFTTTACYGAMFEGTDDPSTAVRNIFEKLGPGGSSQSTPSQYLYYPDSSVYFDPQREVYFYPVNGQWVESSVLPKEIRMDSKRFFTLDMMTDKPYQFHSEVVKLYPGQDKAVQGPGGGPPPWAPAHGQRAKYSYLYYPEASVYFDPQRELYFYPVQSRWTKAPTLPDDIRNLLKSFITLDMMTPNPYEFHDEVIRFHPSSVRVIHKPDEVPPPWAPAHGRRAEYEYRYYPASTVYHDVRRNLYFYPVNEQWIKAPTLPAHIHLSPKDFVDLGMITPVPYTFHQDVIRWYPSTFTRTVSYRYHYYPASSVYYDPGRNVYYYLSDGRWKGVETLPKTIRINTKEFVVVDLDSEKPYVHHKEIVKRYPKTTVHHKVHLKEKEHHKVKDHYKREVKIKEHKGKVHYKEKIHHKH